MQFHEAANFLFDLRRYPPRPGLAATEGLLAHLDDPQGAYDAVQVAGSNGKGSTARMLERVLREAGLDVGLYTSPHLDDVRERVRINGRKLTRQALVEYVEAVRPYITAQAAAGDPPTFFETLTGLALWAFRRADVDVAVLEVGIGGRHDATSVVDPVASAVTAVTLEHTDILGDTIGEIARDKAHVAPADRPLVTGTTGEALDAVRDVAGEVTTVAETGADVTVDYGGREGLEGAVSLEGTGWRVETKLPLLGEHQARNAGIAAALARQVADVSTTDLARGLRNAHWPGRFEVMGQEPLVVLDGAHNPGGCAAVAETLSTFAYDDLHVVVGAMSDKDHAGIAAALPTPDRVVTCEPDVDRAEDDAVLARAFENEYPESTVQAGGDVADAYEAAMAAAGPDDCVLVTGSLYCVGEVRTDWTRPTVPERARDTADAERVLRGADVDAADAESARADLVHHVVRTRVQPRQARRLRSEMLALGGACVVSALDSQDQENVGVVLSGTRSQFGRLVEMLDTRRRGLPSLADDLRAQLDIDGHGADERGYPWEDGTAVMGILNATPDSFHDGGEYNAVEDAVARAEEMVENGVDIIDIGGESTRPGADPVPPEEEKERVVPVIERIADLDVHISIDTRKADVGRAALDAGADILNDVSGLEDPEMRLLAAERDVPVVVMHSIETPVDPDTDIEYDDVVSDVLDELTERVLLAEKAGLDREQIIVDPGVGFGKSAAESFELLGRIGEFRSLGCPVLVGHSQKSMFEHVGRGPDERLQATVAATTLAAERGADIVRVHDVKENVAAVRTVAAADDSATDSEE